MSMVISFAPVSAAQTLAARQKRVLRQRSLLIAGTLLLTGGMAAIPLPVWKASAAIASRAEELQGWIDHAQVEQAQATAFVASGRAGLAERVHQDLSRWLAPHDRLETTKHLLQVARSAGLSITRADVVPDTELLLVDEARRSDGIVLGTSVARAADTTPRVHGTPLQLSADRYVFEGRGPSTSLLLFCGVLAAMPTPLRLRTVHLKADETHLRFTITLEKLHEQPNAEEPLSPAEFPTEDVP